MSDNGNSFDEAEERYLGVDPEERKKRREIMEQRSGQKLVKDWQQEDRAVAAEIERKYAPPVINEKRCHVCQSPHRPWIERKLMEGVAYAAIAHYLPARPDGEKFDYRQISSHAKKHMPIDEAVMRQLMEDEADLLGQNWESSVKGAFTMRGALEVLIRKAFKDAMDGITTVEPRDMIQMIRAFNEMNTSTSTVAIEEAKTSIRIFMAGIQNVLLKGDFVDREEGQRILEAIGAEVESLRNEESIEQHIEAHLLPPAAA